MRALPPRTEQGSIPQVGRLVNNKAWWFVGGLGARGVLYHAWLAQTLARAVVADDESVVDPPELLSWKPIAQARRLGCKNKK